MVQVYEIHLALINMDEAKGVRFLDRPADYCL